jgi:dTDP-4-dehydrorhamnose reductase
MRHERVLITGCGGMLGNAIYPYFKERFPHVFASDIEIEEDEKSWLHFVDARDSTGVAQAFNDFKPDLVLHLAALVDVEICEDNPEDAEEENVTATRIVAENAKQHGASMVYISTGGVFDGEKPEGYYTEDDKPNPIMVYGATKLEGEHVTREILDEHYIIRAGWMVGGGRRNDHKFTWLILEQLEAGADVIYGAIDNIGTPTYTHDFAMNLFALLEREKFGTYHMVCKGSGTRLDVAQHILDVCGRNDVRVEPVNSDFFKERFFVRRPTSEKLFNQRLEELGINLMRPWREAMADYIHREYPEFIRKAAATGS